MSLNPSNSEQIMGGRLLKVAALSDYFGWMPSLQGWLKKKEDGRAEKKLVTGNRNIITSQGKARKTVSFGYKNMAGVDRVREVEPYEIKDGFLWGREHGKPQIKRYFLNRMKKTQAGANTFEPAYEVKLGMRMLKVAGII